MDSGKLHVRSDDGRTVAVDPAVYKDLDHGYAVTIHKSQGVTVDEAFVLASRGFDRHTTYVSCSRHRASLSIVYSRESFGSEAHLMGVLGRDRAKDTTLDYREAEPQVGREDVQSEVERALLERQRQMDERKRGHRSRDWELER